MQMIEEYRTRAGECRELAKLAMTQGQRAMILDIADTWEKLAQSRKAFLQFQADKYYVDLVLPWRRENPH